MKRFRSIFFLFLLTANFLVMHSIASAQSGIVAAPGATFTEAPPEVTDSTAQNQILKVQQNYNTYMNPVVAATPVDPAVLAAQAAAQQAADAAKQAQTAGLIQLGAQMCSAFAGGNTITKAQQTANDSIAIAMAARESQGFQYPNGISHSYAATIGAAGATHFAKGCENFINKDGKTKSWGELALGIIRDHPKSFSENVPGDIAKWCPNYTKFSKEQKDLYWVWTLTSMASSESNCNPGNNNPNAPHGTAIGLFQLENKICSKANNLSDPYQNITCAVDRLSKELDGRDNLMSPTSTSSDTSRNTYWGPLRCDDANSRRGGDILGSLKTRCLMTQYTGCGKPERKCDFLNKDSAYAGLNDLRINCTH